MNCNHEFKKLTKDLKPIIEWCKHCGALQITSFEGETVPEKFIERPRVLTNLTAVNFDNETSNIIHKTIIPLLENHGWNQFDDAALEKVIDDKKAIIVIFPKFISYFVDKTVVVEIWYKCRLSIAHEQVQPVSNDLLEAFKEFSIKPFKDEDAFRSYFSLKPYTHHSDLSFFLNPHHLNGVWSNHAIENA